MKFPICMWLGTRPFLDIGGLNAYFTRPEKILCPSLTQFKATETRQVRKEATVGVTLDVP